MALKYKLMGSSDDANYCSCCGRQGLKRVVWLAPLDVDGNIEDEPAPYGTSCAATLLGYAYPGAPKTKKLIEKAAAQAMKDAVNAECLRIRDEHLTLVHHAYYVLHAQAVDARLGLITINECFLAREEAFPILKTWGGKMSVEEAFKLVRQSR